MTARQAARPMPLSAPSVVPSAWTHSPLIGGLDGVLGEVVDDVGILLADHVEVTLEDDADGAFAPGRRLLADDDVADLVLLRFEAERRGRRQDVLAEGFFVARAMGDASGSPRSISKDGRVSDSPRVDAMFALLEIVFSRETGMMPQKSDGFKAHLSRIIGGTRDDPMNRKRLNLWLFGDDPARRRPPPRRRPPAEGRIRILASVSPSEGIRRRDRSGTGERRPCFCRPGPGSIPGSRGPAISSGWRNATFSFYIGAGLEPWLPGLLKGLAKRRPATLEASAGLRLASERGRGRTMKTESTTTGRSILMSGSISTWTLRIVGGDRGQADGPRSRRRSGLSPERGRARRRVSGTSTPGTGRDLRGCSGKAIVLAGHAAFGYLARRYGLEQIVPLRD